MSQNKMAREPKTTKSIKLGYRSAHQKKRPEQLAKGRVTEVKLKIDQLLQKDFVFLRNHHTQANWYGKLQINKHNDLIHEYVHNNYEEYRLQDPLPTLPHQIMFHSQIKQSGKKSQKIHIYSASKTKSKLGQSHLRNQSQEKMKFRTQPNQEEFRRLSTKPRINGPELSRDQQKTEKIQIHLRKNTKATQPYTYESHATQSKNYYTHYKGIPSDFSVKLEDTQLDSKQLIQSHYINQTMGLRTIENREFQAKSLKFQKEKEKNPFHEIQIKPTNQQQFSERFRYCIGCERALLQINIDYHEKVCNEFKYAFSLNFQQLRDLIAEKIGKLEKQIIGIGQSSPMNKINIHELYTDIVQASSQIRKTGIRTQKFIQSYNSLIESSGDQLQHLQKVSKLNWFLQIYENIRKKLKI